jgi:hypothetical protein|tara:strand:- start:3203 stop:3562 length:360 start_codon:yes stop_codon:yes gene_type:complete
MEVNIKTKLLYFWEDDFQEFKDTASKAILEHWGAKAEEHGNLPDLLIWILQNRENTPIKTSMSKGNKHNKTTLLYFGEQEHKIYTKYLDMFVFKNMEKEACKKQAQTQAIFSLLKEYIG